jgi:hypothetical protein
MLMGLNFGDQIHLIWNMTVIVSKLSIAWHGGLSGYGSWVECQP